MTSGRRIIFVPGKNPKPPAEAHRKLLMRCLIQGVRKNDPGIAEEISAMTDAISLTAWNYDYYQRHKNEKHEIYWIDKLLEKASADNMDKKEAVTWRSSLVWQVYSVVDRFPFLINYLPVAAARSIVQETSHYFENHNDIACRIRQLLKDQLHEAFTRGERILLIGHSMGSIIAWDTICELIQSEKNSARIDCFLTIGSPLGMHFVQHRMKGIPQKPDYPCPVKINSWTNIAARGDLVALDNSFRDDFAAAVKTGLIGSIRDINHNVFNYYRNEKGLNVHRSYGYLVNKVVGKTIADWWRNEQT